ncbi:MAG: acetyltransferase [Marinirhabdus sp.]|nr:acetyltransferase [Marinirhabdus sp.]
MSNKKDIVIVGAGGFGREVLVLLKTINSEASVYNILGFIDDNVPKNTKIHDQKVLGNVAFLKNMSQRPKVVFAIGDSEVKKQLATLLVGFEFETLIHPSIDIQSFQNIDIGKGVILCEGNLLTTDITIEDFVLINISCTVGHDAVLKKYSSIMPGCNISGEVTVGECVFVGTGTKIVNQMQIGNGAIIGAGSVVAKDIPANCTAVGVPAKPIKFN